MSITRRVLAPAAGGERCHFLVQWRDCHAIQHGRTFTTWKEAAEFDSAIKAGRLPRDAPGRRAALTFGMVAARWLATKQATKRPRTAGLYATELRSHVLPAFAGMPLASKFLYFAGYGRAADGRQPLIMDSTSRSVKAVTGP